MNNFEIYKTLLDNFLQKSPNNERVKKETSTGFDEKNNQNVLNLLLSKMQDGKLNLEQIINLLGKAFKKQTTAKTEDNLNQTNKPKEETPQKSNDNLENKTTKNERIITANVNPLINALKRHDDFVNRINNPVKKG